MLTVGNVYNYIININSNNQYDIEYRLHVNLNYGRYFETDLGNDRSLAVLKDFKIDIILSSIQFN